MLYTKAKLDKMNAEDLGSIVEAMGLENIEASGKDGSVLKGDMVEAIINEQLRLKEISDAKAKNEPKEKKILRGKFGHPMQLVKVSNLDTREKDIPQDYIGWGNDFEEIRRVIPFGEQVTIEDVLADHIKHINMMIHVAEKDSNGKSTGNRRPEIKRKYVVEVIKKEIEL